jgi:type IV pilus assembly protein PilQ
MKTTEQDVRRGVAVAVGFLLLGFIGCTATIERDVGPAMPGPAEASAPSASSDAVLDQAAAEPAAVAAELDQAVPEPAAAPALVGEEEAPVEARLRVHEIVLSQIGGRQALVIRLSRPPDRLQHFALSSPNRVVIDLGGPLPAGTTNRTHPVLAEGIDSIREGTFEGALRIVADIEGPLPDYAVEQGDRTVIALLGPSTEPASDQVVYLAPGVRPASFAQEDHASEDSAPQMVLGAATQADPAAPAFEGALTDRDSPAVPDYGTAVAGAGNQAEAAEIREAESARGDTPERVEPEPTPADPHAHGTDAVAEPPVFEKPTNYALAAQAGGKSKGKAASKSKVTTIEGGRLETLPRREPKEFTGQRISLDFKDADIQNVLRILADVSGLNIITTEDVSGRLTMRLVDVPWDQALDAILQAKGLDMVRDGNIVRVSTVEQLKKERDAQRAADEAQKQVEPLLVSYVKVNYAKADEKLVKKVQEVLTERGQATWDERTNTIVIRDIARGIADAEELIKNFDTQTPQVLIEANIVEATDDLIRDLGIQWGYTYKASPETGNATGVNFPGRIVGTGVLAGGKNSPAGAIPFIADFPAAAVTGGAGTAYDVMLGSLDGSNSLAARLTALESQGKGKIISRPRVVTLNNVPAKIESLRILRVKLPSSGTVISTGAGGVAGGSQVATEQIRTGITLQVTPQVSSDGFIFLDVYAKSSTIAESTSPDNIPDEVSREAESHVLIADGETFVLGGVFRNVLRDTERGIPYLRAIPVLGWVFRNNLKNDERSELLVFVTPRAVQAPGTQNVASLPTAESLWQNRPHP